MSVLMEFAMFPTDKGDSKSEYVSQVIKMIRDTAPDYRLTAMGTIIETESLDEALDIIRKAHAILDESSGRIYSTIKLDIRKGKSNRLEGKISSVEGKIGEVKK